MDDSQQELKNVLQTLALPVTGQVHLVEDDCTRVEALAGAFDAAHHAIREEGEGPLAPGQAAALVALEDRLAEVRRQSPPAVCSELSMRQSAGWRQIRRMARETLVRFDWPLEMPLLPMSAEDR